MPVPLILYGTIQNKTGCQDSGRHIPGGNGCLVLHRDGHIVEIRIRQMVGSRLNSDRNLRRIRSHALSYVEMAYRQKHVRTELSLSSHILHRFPNGVDAGDQLLRSFR